MNDDDDALRIREIPGTDLPMDLLLLADPSERKIAAYLPGARGFVAYVGQDIAGACAVVTTARAVCELMAIAVAPSAQQRGIGTQLLRHAIAAVGASGAARLDVGTGTFGHQLAFYQRQGFRVTGVERDFFLRHYPEPLFEDGIQHRDMLRLAYVYPRGEGADDRAPPT